MMVLSFKIVSLYLVSVAICTSPNDSNPSTSRRFRFPRELQRMVVSHMSRIDHLSYLLSASQEDVIPTIPHLTLDQPETIQYITNPGFYRILHACVSEPDVNIHTANIGASLELDAHPHPVTSLTHGCANLSRFITYVNLRDTQISDISNLGFLTRVNYLNLSNTQVSDLRPLVNLSGSLRFLILSNSPVTDISVLTECRGLYSLSLDNTQVRDLSPLRDLGRLGMLSVSASNLINEFSSSNAATLATMDNLVMSLVDSADDVLAMIAEGSFSGLSLVGEDVLSRVMGEDEEMKLGTWFGWMDVFIRNGRSRSILLRKARHQNA